MCLFTSQLSLVLIALEGWPGWVDLGGWLHTEMVYPSTHPSINRACRWLNFVDVTNNVTNWAKSPSTVLYGHTRKCIWDVRMMMIIFVLWLLACFKRRWSALYTEMRDRSQVYRFHIRPSHPGQLSLAIPSWIGKMSTGDGYGYRWGRNCKFCVTLGSVTRTVGILAQLVKGSSC